MAGVTVAAMLVPQAMAYALLAGLPPEIGLYAATVPVVAYAVLGTSRQLAVGPVAIVSLMTAAALGPVVEESGADYLAVAALLALMVGLIHLLLAAGRLGGLVNYLSHSVLVGFSAAAAMIIGFSQAKHLLGITVPRADHFLDTVVAVVSSLGDTHPLTLALGSGSLAILVALKRLMPAAPAALLVVVASTGLVELLDLRARGVRVVGDIPSALPGFGLPTFSGGLVGSLLASAAVITLVGFMESTAVSRVYARRHGYDIDPNQELIGLGAANVAAGLFGGYPVTGGFSRTAVNDSAGARTPVASLVTAGLVLLTIAMFAPLLSSLPNAALGAIIVAAVAGLVDIREMRHIGRVKPSDLVGLVAAAGATLALGIELGIGIALAVSLLVVFVRMSRPHLAVLGAVPGTSHYRNIDRFPEVDTHRELLIVRVDAAVSFVNATRLKGDLLRKANEGGAGVNAFVLDASGIGDMDAAGLDMLEGLVEALDQQGIVLHLADVKGPVRDVLHRSGLWERLDGRIHPSVHDAVTSIAGGEALGTGPSPAVDERTRPSAEALP